MFLDSSLHCITHSCDEVNTKETSSSGYIILSPNMCFFAPPVQTLNENYSACTSIRLNVLACVAWSGNAAEQISSSDTLALNNHKLLRSFCYGMILQPPTSKGIFHLKGHNVLSLILYTQYSLTLSEHFS